MNLLAVETSTDLCSVALRAGERLHVDEARIPNRHAERLEPMARALLGEAGLVPSDLDGFAFGQGPGSFTGIRIGCGFIQGLAFALDRPVIPVPSLEALAQASGAARVATALDARMGEAYFAAYESGPDGWIARIAPCLVAPGEIPPLPGTGWWSAGSGFEAFDWLRDACAASLAGHCSSIVPGAGAVAKLAAVRLGRGEGIRAEDAAPLYLRDKVARTVAERQAGP
ncbi:MAG TPA: tRNA (adenosine(37)-N6)-threonylcarbamoyltransferase complex dimerization subunit type 1 TsaB [Usitatibacteraceae bacterium]|nr:tRNA (adenosine(37)-N6)-threonylcarbamoyltransferase complex dimerization subunit type 1 TsaB [Usitatibacteraceae bacterium]